MAIIVSTVLGTVLIRVLVYLAPIILGLVLPVILVHFTDWGQSFYKWIVTKGVEAIIFALDSMNPIDGLNLQDMVDSMPPDVVNIMGMVRLDVCLLILVNAYITRWIVSLQIKFSKVLFIRG